MPSGEADQRGRLGTRLVGGRVARYETIDSTNLEALRLAARGFPVGTAVIAGTQTAGRGRLGRRWMDVPGRCLLMSVLVDAPPVPGLLTAAMALSATQVLALEHGLPARIKWPNDVLLAGRKVAGVLAEGPDAGPMALGIGINVNGRPGELPAGATFVSHHLGEELDLDALAAAVLRRLDAHYHSLVAGDAGPVVEELADYDCLTGRRVMARAGGRTLFGEALGWLPDGRLAICDDAGETIHLDAGEVTLI